MQAPVMILNANTKREHGRKAQLANIQAAKSVAEIIRTTLGPRSMLKMLLDPMGGIVMTNDGNAILREVDVSHPAAKSMIELSRTQDEEVGDGTTSVIILAGELLSVAEQFLHRNMHPRVIVGAYIKALDDALVALEQQSIQLDTNNSEEMLALVRSTLGTKFVSRFGDLIANLAIQAVNKVTTINELGHKEIDIKRYARIEKIPGGYLNESIVLDGVMLNKDVVHPKMRRRIESPVILLLDCPLEFKKAESQTNIEVTKEGDWETILHMEEEYIEKLCTAIIALKPDLVLTEKGISDLAAHYLAKANITAFRRLKKTDAQRIARATGATIISNPVEGKKSDLGTRCGLFEIEKIGDEYFTYIYKCRDAKACTILLRGGSKDVLNEMERNLLDAMNVTRNIVMNSRIVAGGGSTELAMSAYITRKSKSIQGISQYPYRAVATALEIIPKTLIDNCGGSAIKILTAVRAKHAAAAESNTRCTYGVDGNKGEIADLHELKIYEPYNVKVQTIKTAVEAACMLLRIDDIVSGATAAQKSGGGQQPQDTHDEDTFGDARDG